MLHAACPTKLSLIAVLRKVTIEIRATHQNGHLRSCGMNTRRTVRLVAVTGYPSRLQSLVFMDESQFWTRLSISGDTKVM